MYNVVDILPTLLGLSGIDIPETIEGKDHSPALGGEPFEGNDASLTMGISPFSEFQGQAWRGVRTQRYTYVRQVNGPWLLYDNLADPDQLDNLIDNPDAASIRDRLDSRLEDLLSEREDELLPGPHYLEKYNLTVNERGGIPYTR